jgi:hypothetical protein
VEKGLQQADTEEVARVIGWSAALAVVPSIVYKFRRGWSRLSDIGEFYVLMGVLLWGVSAAHRRALGLPSLSLLVMTLSATVLYGFAFHSPSGTSWLEPGAKRLPTKLERRLIRLMPMMAWVLAFEAGGPCFHFVAPSLCELAVSRLGSVVLADVLFLRHGCSRVETGRSTSVVGTSEFRHSGSGR